MVAAFAICKLIQEKAFQGPDQYRSILKDMRIHAGQLKKASECKKNEVGKKILNRMRELLQPLSISWEGPHEWQDLDVLCRHYKVQVVVFCQVMGNRPMYFFPLDQKQPNPAFPTFFFL